MISFIKGKIEIVGEDFVVIENNNMGFKVKVSLSTLAKLQKSGEEVKIFTHMQVREDDISLYGFMSMEEISMFNLLTSVSGIGAKGALGILNVMQPTEIMLCIIAEDVDTFCKAPGVGKKTASRLILELKDKIKSKSDTYESLKFESVQSGSGLNTDKQDAIDALIALGYDKNESFKVVLEVALTDMTVEEIIKASLKKFLK